MKIKYLWLAVVFGILILASVIAAKPKPKQGMCHVCKCTQKADKCIKECGSPKICIIACKHNCVMAQLKIKKCPVPQKKTA